MKLSTKSKAENVEVEEPPMILTEWGERIPVSEYAEAQRRYEAAQASD